MKAITSLFFALGLSLSCQAASRVMVTVTITNTPANGSTFTLNGVTRTWTNLLTVAKSQIQITNGVSPTATNLYLQAVAYGFAGPVILNQPSSNQVTFLGQIDQAMSASVGGGWASLTYSTNTESVAIAPKVLIAGEAARNQQPTMAVFDIDAVLASMANVTNAQTAFRDEEFHSMSDTNIEDLELLLELPAEQGKSK